MVIKYSSKPYLHDLWMILIKRSRRSGPYLSLTVLVQLFHDCISEPATGPTLWSKIHVGLYEENIQAEKQSNLNRTISNHFCILGELTVLNVNARLCIKPKSTTTCSAVIQNNYSSWSKYMYTYTTNWALTHRASGGPFLNTIFCKITNFLISHKWRFKGGKAGIILGMSSANARRRYIATSYPIGWANNQHDP